MPDTNPLETLSSLLDDQRLRIVVRPERIAPSTTYDLDYRATVIAMTFIAHTKPDLVGGRRLPAARLKLLQFVACRPWLLPVLRRWSEQRQDPQASLLFSQRLRRGFLGDTMHDDVIAFMVARDILRESDTFLASGIHGDLLERWSSTSADLGVFEREREVVGELANIRITNDMLEGW